MNEPPTNKNRRGEVWRWSDGVPGGVRSAYVRAGGDVFPAEQNGPGHRSGSDQGQDADVAFGRQDSVEVARHDVALRLQSPNK